jgi:hypothetical protein
MQKGSTAASGSRVLLTRREFVIRILKGLIVLMLKVTTNLVMCSGRNFNTGDGSTIRIMCRWTRQVTIKWKLRWIADMIGEVDKMLCAS